MIERHYFRNKLIKSYDFTFPFCIPGSTNNWDVVYSVPPLQDDLMNDMVNNPFETYSDSFYFVDEELVMHNKVSYSYAGHQKVGEVNLVDSKGLLSSTFCDETKKMNLESKSLDYNNFVRGFNEAKISSPGRAFDSFAAESKDDDALKLDFFLII
mmetsp:Transcript_488/g.680  ORF Transcript_488/g.680 Transcript_488/m.680 type:complete len:155 (+) Transcript_488:477-941(+)